MAWNINTPLEWLSRALNLRSGDSPSLLSDGEVNTVLEVLQGGVAVGAWTFESADMASAAIENFVICERDNALTRLVVLNFTKTGVAAAAEARLLLLPPFGASASLRLAQIFAMTNTTDGSWSALMQGAQWVIVPPGFQLRARHSGLVAPDTLEVRAAILAVPAGGKPW